MHVPQLDLKKQLSSIRSEIADALLQVLDSCAFAGGPFVDKFEEEFAGFCGCRYGVGVSNGTEALWLTLLALGVGPGDEVITVPNTFIATAEAISFCGARPVFVDVEERYNTVDPTLLDEAITPRTRAVIPVHLFGEMADMEPIVAIARAKGLAVVEDASQAHGAEYRGRRAGSLGTAGCFSFYPTKNLGACGEAGMVVTDDPLLQERLRMLRNHGQIQRYEHSMLGWNGRMDGFQAAVLSVKLKQLNAWNDARARLADCYDGLLANVPGVRIPSRRPNGRHVFHLYTVRVSNRDGLLRALEQSGVCCAVHYPNPLHLQEAYRFLGYSRGAFPVAERFSEEILSLPLFPELSEEQVRFVAEQVRQFSVEH
jgi:dTDP-4-amino-4,6-dideoxygalactose transaminase